MVQKIVCQSACRPMQSSPSLEVRVRDEGGGLEFKGLGTKVLDLGCRAVWFGVHGIRVLCTRVLGSRVLGFGA